MLMLWGLPVAMNILRMHLRLMFWLKDDSVPFLPSFQAGIKSALIVTILGIEVPRIFRILTLLGFSGC